MIALFKYLKGCHTKEGQDLFSILPECRTRNNGLKLQEARFRLDIRHSRGSWTAICQVCFELDSCNAQGVGLDGLVIRGLETAL